VTAGNASGINDGAAARGGDDAPDEADALGLTPLAAHRVRTPSAGVDPADHGHGPGARLAAGAGHAPAGRPPTSTCMEINEAFAAQACAVNQEMGWDTVEGQRQRRRDRARPSDRRLGLPHARHAAARDAVGAMPRRASPSLCIGGGMGVALAVERG
jgi:acetyl-CoA C-acetyltransferase